MSNPSPHAATADIYTTSNTNSSESLYTMVQPPSTSTGDEPGSSYTPSPFTDVTTSSTINTFDPLPPGPSPSDNLLPPFAQFNEPKKLSWDLDPAFQVATVASSCGSSGLNPQPAGTLEWREEDGRNLFNAPDNRSCDTFNGVEGWRVEHHDGGQDNNDTDGRLGFWDILQSSEPYSPFDNFIDSLLP
jgi:hypothetical protein